MPSRTELETWIADTRRNQRRLARGLGAAAVVALGLLVWSRPIGGAALAIVAIVAICGFWILAAHLADWRGKLAALDRPPVRSSHRRYER